MLWYLSIRHSTGGDCREERTSSKNERCRGIDFGNDEGDHFVKAEDRASDFEDKEEDD